MIYIIKKMFKADGNYVELYSELRGVNPIFNKTNIPTQYPSDTDVIKSLEYAAGVHKEVRRFLQPYLKPGIKLIDIAKLIELKTTQLSNQSKSINKGIGFPVGLAVNDCVAHWHPSSSNKTILTKDDVIKIDFGTEANGWIVDSAFTICFDRKYDILIEAVKEATYHGINNIGVDVNIGEWGKEIQEVIESYEITLDGKTYPIKSISNVGGHNITKGIIHAGLFLPIVDLREQLKNNRFKEGVYAVETFGSTKDNYAYTDSKSENNTNTDSKSENNTNTDSTLYRINPHKKLNLNFNSESTNLLNQIKTRFNTLPFTDRYIESNKIPNYKNILKNLSDNNYLHSYPPLYVKQGYTAQYEHTIYIGENKKIIFSNGEDY
jgi:methionyl aminopeptidase